MTTPAVTPTAPLEAIVIALRHLDAAARLEGRYGADRDRDEHVRAARAVLAAAKRAEDSTRPTDAPPKDAP